MALSWMETVKRAFQNKGISKHCDIDRLFNFESYWFDCWSAGRNIVLDQFIIKTKAYELLLK